MAYYAVRIELHYASDSDYLTLHRAMWNAGFRRFVVGDDKKMYLLPTGSYITIANASLQEIFNRAKSAADSTGKSSWIWMVERGAAQWILKAINADPDAR